MILKNANASAIAALAVKQGMLTMRDLGLRRVAEGTTTFEEVLRSTSAD
jgi:type II secretory ATPase GspE/PulE/Tfp pilus assembly ATPase PilB-like protein